MRTTETIHPSPTPTGITVVRRFVDEVLNRGCFDALPEIIHPDYRYEGPDGTQLYGPDELQLLVAGFHAGFSDFHVEITSEVEQGDLVAMTMTLTGTNDGDFDGIPATGARLELPMAVFTRIEGDRIIDDREFYDTATLLSQLVADADVDDHAPARQR